MRIPPTTGKTSKLEDKSMTVIELSQKHNICGRQEAAGRRIVMAASRRVRPLRPTLVVVLAKLKVMALPLIVPVTFCSPKICDE